MKKTTDITNLQEKIDHLNHQAWETRVYDSPQSFTLSEEALGLSQKINYKKGYAQSMQGLGFCHIRLSNNNEALPLIKDSLAMFEELGDLVGQACGHEYLALIRRNWGDFGGAIKLLFKALEFAEPAGAKENIATITYQLGVTYKYLGKFEKALEYLDKSMILYKDYGKEIYGSYPINVIGSIFFENGDYTKALEYYKKSLLMREESNDKWGMAGSLDNIGFTYFKLKDYKQAIDYCFRSLEMSRPTDDKRSQASALIHLAEIYKEMGDLEKAISFSNESLKIRQATGDKRGQAEIQLFLAELYSKDGDGQKTEEWLSVALKIAEEMKALDLISKTRFRTYEYYKKQGRFEEAISYLSSHLELEKELHKNTIDQKMTNLEVSRKAEEARKESELVRQRNDELTKLNNEIARQKEELELKNRELEIETALERVRSVAIAMQKSSDLHKVINTVSEQLVNLGFQFDAANFVTDQTEQGYKMWLAAPGENFPLQIFVPAVKEQLFGQIYDELAKGKDFITYVLTKEEKDIWFRNFFENTILKDHPNEPKERIYKRKGMAASMAVVKNIRFNVANFEGIPYTEEENAIIKRFAAVFEQSYIRFLDLQTAEAQAKEALIEAALERVRSRAMAMQNSDELNILIGTLFSEMTKLDLALTRCAIWIFDKEGGTRWLMANSEDPSNPNSYYLPHHEHEPYLAFLNGWKNKESRFVYELKGEIKNKWDDFLFHQSELSNLPAVVKDGMRAPDRVFLSASFNNFGAINVATLEPLSDEHFDILLRFARVFEMTYTRFYDLKQAEAQAREAQIQLALERVRARTMAMQKSEELADAAVVLFQQFAAIGETPDRISIGIVNEESDTTDVWATDQAGTQINIHFKARNTEPTTIGKIVKAWKAGDKMITVDLRENELQDWIGYLRNELGMSIDDSYFHGRRLHQVSFFSQGWLNITSLDPLPAETLELLHRFAAVFNLTYTRFTDLKRAEAQAREAKIEASLERVRARAMAMHKTEDLNEAVATVFEQLASLDIGVLRCGIGILNREKPSGDVWVTTSTGEGQLVQVAGDEAMDIHPLLLGAYNAWLKNTDFSYVLKGEDMARYYQALGPTNFHLPQSQLILSAKEDGYEQHYFVTPFEHGTVFAFCEHAFPDSVRKVIKRFASVFDMTYKRFLDIRKAEMNAREARIETSLERVRAKAMGMHSSEDLSEAINLFYHELGVLGIVPRRCGVSLIDKEARIGQVSSMGSTEQGESLVINGPLRLSGHPVLDAAFDHWVQQKEYHVVLRGEEIKNYYEVVQPQLKFPNSNKSDIQYGYYFYFPEGCVFVWTTEETKEENLEIFRRFTSVLSLTYRRYKELIDAEERARARLEDFKKLEEAKNRTEVALNELKATQSQLIQAEKMASLGELTAGIAHEIQNPLNFVNNFSEVNAELIDELKEELATGNWQSVKEIAENLKDNEEKISHHGKRADAIVKSMLQHSRISSGTKELTNINELVDEYIRLSYHGLRAKDKSFNSKYEVNFDHDIPKINIVPQDMGRVILNLINNAFYAVNEKKKKNPSGYEPYVLVNTALSGDHILLSVKDNGNGMGAEVREKIFQPFFTTKPTGQGTGLGLSLSYDIVKAHQGELKVETKEGEGSTFTILLPSE